MSAALLEAARARSRSDDDDRVQRPLFEELRRATESPHGADAPEVARGAPADDPGERRPRSGGGRLTLEDLLERTWEGLLAAGVAECVVCGGPFERTGTGGACRQCGSTLS